MNENGDVAGNTGGLARAKGACLEKEDLEQSLSVAWGHLVCVWSPDSSLKKPKPVGLKSKPSTQSFVTILQSPFAWNQWLLHVIPDGAGPSLGSGRRALLHPGNTQQQSRPFSNQDRGYFWELGSLKENSTVSSKLRNMSFSHTLIQDFWLKTLYTSPTSENCNNYYYYS